MRLYDPIRRYSGDGLERVDILGKEAEKEGMGGEEGEKVVCRCGLSFSLVISTRWCGLFTDTSWSLRGQLFFSHAEVSAEIAHEVFARIQILGQGPKWLPNQLYFDCQLIKFANGGPPAFSAGVKGSVTISRQYDTRTYSPLPDSQDQLCSLPSAPLELLSPTGHVKIDHTAAPRRTQNRHTSGRFRK